MFLCFPLACHSPHTSWTGSIKPMQSELLLLDVCFVIAARRGRGCSTKLRERGGEKTLWLGTKSSTVCQHSCPACASSQAAPNVQPATDLSQQQPDPQGQKGVNPACSSDKGARALHIIIVPRRLVQHDSSSLTRSGGKHQRVLTSLFVSVFQFESKKSYNFLFSMRLT